MVKDQTRTYTIETLPTFGRFGRCGTRRFWRYFNNSVINGIRNQNVPRTTYAHASIRDRVAALTSRIEYSLLRRAERGAIYFAAQ